MAKPDAEIFCEDSDLNGTEVEASAYYAGWRIYVSERNYSEACRVLEGYFAHPVVALHNKSEGTSAGSRNILKTNLATSLLLDRRETDAIEIFAELGDDVNRLTSKLAKLSLQQAVGEYLSVYIDQSSRSILREALGSEFGQCFPVERKPVAS